MGTKLEEMDDDIAELARLISDLRTVGARLLECADSTRPGERAFHARLTDAISQLSLLGRTQHGMLLQLVSRAQQHRAIPGGAPAWLAATQGVSNGHARALVNDAKHLTTDPEVAQGLSEGAFSQDATRVLARSIKAVIDTDPDTRRQVVADTISQIQCKGVTNTAKQVLQLERTISAQRSKDVIAAQRARSYARVIELDDGSHRYHLLLDSERASRLNAALESYMTHVYQRRHYDHVEVLPADVHTTEQIAAQAFTRLGEAFLKTNDAHREAALRGPTAVNASADSARPRTGIVHGRDRSHPTSAALGRADSQADALTREPAHHADFQKNRPVDAHPLRRLATRLQRTALAYRDRPCTFPGCLGTAGWPLHARQVKPLRDGGLNELRNLMLYCPEHQAAGYSSDR